MEADKCDKMYQSIKNNSVTMIDITDNFIDGASVSKMGDKTFNICKNCKNLYSMWNFLRYLSKWWYNILVGWCITYNNSYVEKILIFIIYSINSII